MQLPGKLSFHVSIYSSKTLLLSRLKSARRTKASARLKTPVYGVKLSCSMEFQRVTITKNDDGRRVDRVVRRFLPDIPLSAIYKLMRRGFIRIDGKKILPETRCRESSCLEIEIHTAKASRPGRAEDCRQEQALKEIPHNQRNHNIKPENIIILKTRDFLFINKPAGIPVHGDDSLCSVIPREKEAEESLSFRTGPLHRLDKDTTGIITFSRTLDGARWFSENLREKKIGKFYLGIIDGECGGKEIWRDIFKDKKGGEKMMETDFFPVTSTEGKTLAVFRIHTGCKHQIRRQASMRGHPLSGDLRYGGSKLESGLRGGYFLHAFRLVFPDERPEDLPEKITAPFPERLEKASGTFFGENILADMLSCTYTFNG